MKLSLDPKLLNLVIIVLVIGIAITGFIIGLKMAGIFGGVAKSSLPDSSRNDTPQEGNTSVTNRSARSAASAVNVSDQKNITIAWRYNNETFRYQAVLSNKTYTQFRTKTPPPANRTGNATILPYITTAGDEGAVQNISRYLLGRSQELGWGDYDTVRNTLTFLRIYNQLTDFRNTSPAASHKYPYETLYSGTGTHDDVTILGAAVLESMGYPIAVLVYPQVYDRGYFIHQYQGIAIRCNASIPGGKYAVERDTYVGTVNCSPLSRTCTAGNVSAVIPDEGILRGNTTIVYSGNDTVNAGAGEWDLRLGTITYLENPAAVQTVSPLWYILENASVEEYEYYCFLDTGNQSISPGTVPGELAKTVPEIAAVLADANASILEYQDNRLDTTLPPNLRVPSPVRNSTDRQMTVIGKNPAAELNIPAPSGLVDEVRKANVIAQDSYWEDIWINKSTWYFDDTWYLTVLNSTVREGGNLYTREKEIYVSPASAWRIRYSAEPTIIPDEDVGITQFSDMRFAVYKVDTVNSTATLYDSFSYGYLTGQESIKYRNYYEGGTFYIAVFVRNCEADVSLQMYGRKTS